MCESKSKQFKLTDGSDAYDYLIENISGNFSGLPESRIESDKTDFITNFLENVDSRYGGYFVLRHIVSELANNVYDHSRG